MSDTTTASLAEYRKFVETIVAAEKPSDLFLNRTLDHAAVIVEFLLRSAKETVAILSGGLNPLVYGNPDVIAASKYYLDNTHGTFSILVEDEIDFGSHVLLREIARPQGNRVDVRKVPEDFSKLYPCHFAVVDSASFRYENSKNLPEAIVQFFSPATGKSLMAQFETIRRISRPVAFV